MSKRKFFITIILVLVLLLFFAIKNNFTEKNFLFKEAEIERTNIEQIEILDIHSNNTIMIEEEEGIEKISAFLIKLNSETTELLDVNMDEPIYYMYITNSGLNTNPTITLYKESIVYNGRNLDLTYEESSALTQLLESEFRK